MQLSLFYSYFDLYFMDHVDIGYSQSYVRNKTIDRLFYGNIVQYILMLKFCLKKDVTVPHQDADFHSDVLHSFSAENNNEC